MRHVKRFYRRTLLLACVLSVLAVILAAVALCGQLQLQQQQQQQQQQHQQAGLSLETCGCPSAAAGAPVCANQRTWAVEKAWDAAHDRFVVTTRSSERQVLEGTYLLTIGNAGVPNVTLQSIALALELSSSSSNSSSWLRIAQAVVSPAAACNAANTAHICNGTSNSTMSSSTNSSLVVIDALGNSIVGLGTVAIPEDNDGLDCERDMARFALRYHFDLTTLGVDPALLANQPMRLLVLATFLTGGGGGGGTCAADVDCDGALVAAEQHALTAQTRTYLAFPATCVDQCPCVTLAEDPLAVTFLGNLAQQQPLLVTQTPAANTTVTYCLRTPGDTNVTTLTELQGVNATCAPAVGTCYPQDAPYRISDHVVVTTAAAACVDTFGQALIVQGDATAHFDVTCPAVSCVTPTPTPVPTLVPTPSPPTPVPTLVPTPTPVPPTPVPPTLAPPPTGLLCTYAAGIFQGRQQCTAQDLLPYADVCAERRLDGVKPACLVDHCWPGGEPLLLGPPWIAGLPDTRVTLESNTSLGMGALLRQFAADNVGTPYYLTQTLAFTATGPAGALTTSALNLARQAMAALFSRRLLLEVDNNATVQTAFAQLVFSNSSNNSACADLAGLRVADTLAFADCALGLPYYDDASAPFWPETAASVAAAESLCAVHCSSTGASAAADGACVRFLTTYLKSSGFTSAGVTLWSALARALDLFNAEFAECGAPATGCLVL